MTHFIKKENKYACGYYFCCLMQFLNASNNKFQFKKFYKIQKNKLKTAT